MPQYKVLHDFVGPFPKGHVLTDADLRRAAPAAQGDNADDHLNDVTQRLLSIGAIALTADNRTGDPPPGPENRPKSRAELEAERKAAVEQEADAKRVAAEEEAAKKHAKK